MAPWGLVATIYGLVMACAAVTQPVKRRPVSLAAALAYALTAAGAATLVDSFWANLFIPAVLLLTGYWLSGLLFHTPQPWLEAWLLRIDRRLLAEQWMRHLPRPVAEVLEAAYASVSLVVAAGAIFAATAGLDAIAFYWNLVLAAALASYAPLPWLRSRPPRVIEAVVDGCASRRERVVARPYLRRLNVAILDRASVQANTLPSGHVSAAVAAALGVMAVNETAGWGLMAVAGLIAVAAIAGRYHYAVDCAAGAVVAVLLFISL